MSQPLLVDALGRNAIQEPYGEDSVEADFARRGYLATVGRTRHERLVLDHHVGTRITP